MLHLEQTKTGLELQPSPIAGEGTASSLAASAPLAAMSCGTWQATKRSEAEDT